MINAIAVDDETNALGIIEEFCQLIPGIRLIKCFTDPTKVLPYINESTNAIDLAFLDIQMSRLNGLILAEYLPKDCKIILTTAYPDYALQGYEMDVVDYLLKPFSFERFKRAIEKVFVLQNLSQQHTQVKTNRMKPAGDDFIFVKSDYKTIRVGLLDITFIEGSGNYVTLHTKKGKIMALQNLKKFEEQLASYQFVRVHRSFIVSLYHIDTIEKGWILIDDHEVPIGESYRDQFQQFLADNYKQF